MGDHLRKYLILCFVLASALAGGEAEAAVPAEGPAVAASPLGRYIVVLQDRADAAEVAAEHGKAYGFTPQLVYSHALRGYAATLPESALAGVASRRGVRFVSEDREVRAASCPTVTSMSVAPQCLPTGVDRIDADASSTAAGNARGEMPVNVAVLDTGTEGSHPDLNVVGGVNCTGDKLGALVDPGKIAHGTHVGGTIGAKDNGLGVVGIAPGARLFSVRVLEKDVGGRVSMLLCGLDWVIGTRVNADPTDDIAVANMSLSFLTQDDGNCGRSNQDAIHLAICRAAELGVVSVAAAGNEGEDLASRAPATYDEVLAVTAIVDYDGRPGGLGTMPPEFPKYSCGPEDDDSGAFFSNFATQVTDQSHTIAAPGACIYSTWSEARYSLLSGTSMATPHVAGAVALCIASGRCARLTPQQIVDKIASDAATYNNAKRNSGYGFQDDPLRPISGKYYGYLIRAALY